MSENITRHDPFELIKDLIGSTYDHVVYIPNPGNLGDALIAAATLQNFDSHSISYKIGTKDIISKAEPRTLYVYAGGGNYIPIYHGLRSFLDSLSERKETIVVLPHSSYGMNEHLCTYDGELHFFCRELSTYERLKGVIRNGRLYHHDDVALSFNIKAKELLPYHRYLELVAQLEPHEARLNAFRMDKESRLRQHAKRLEANFDVSTYYDPKAIRWGKLDEASLYEQVSWLFTYLHSFSEIHTDRLHIAIASLLANKKVVAYDNDYGKVSSIYEYSLKPLFPDQITMSTL